MVPNINSVIVEDSLIPSENYISQSFLEAMSVKASLGLYYVGMSHDSCICSSLQ